MRFKATVAMACGAVLAVSGCSSGSGGGNVDGVDRTQIDALTAERDEARAALDALRKSLETAQDALGSATVGEQRVAARKAVTDARTDLREVRQDLEALPDGEAKTAASGALAAVDTALTLTAEALAASPAAPGGIVSLANMHTTLDQAQTALDDAQVKLTTALAADPPTEVRSLLSQAQATLTAAQVSLVPLLRRELADAETEAAAQRARAESAETARNSEKARADAEKERADREKARADSEGERVETERDSAQARADAEKARAESAERERDALKAERLRSLFSNTRRPGTLGATISVGRTARTVANSDGDEWIANPDKLDIATDAVPWAAGMTLTSRAGNEEFPMRAITFRGDIRQGSHRGLDGAAADNDGRFPIVQGPGNTLANASDHTKNAVLSSIRLTEEGGLILKAGGTGIVFNEFQYDIRGTEADGPDGIPGDSGASAGEPATGYHVAMFRRAGETPPAVGDALTSAQATRLTGWAADNCAGVTFPCWDGNMRDLTVDFGLPSLDPDGESGYYWQSKIPSSEGQPKPVVADAMHRWARPKAQHFVDPDRGAGEHRGEYRVWLSNYAGVDADDADDEARFLSYAAYGLFAFTDYLTSNVRPARMQGFHFGYDAFADADGAKTTDLDSPLTATFTGRTSAMVMHPHSDRSQVEYLTRLRGDVTLNATIGGSNTISGAVSGLETPAAGGTWRPFTELSGGVRLRNGIIAADGSYEGVADADGGTSHLWDNGSFGGNFYGDRNSPDLETAGWWYLTARGYSSALGALTGAAARDYPGRPDFELSGAFGSFGAECASGCD